MAVLSQGPLAPVLQLMAVAVPFAGQQALHELRGMVPNDFFGVSVAGGGDLNGDRHPDFIVGAYNYVQQLPQLALGAADRPEQGYVQAFSGRDGTLLHTLRGPSKDFGFGMAVADAGDVDADGHSDIIVGSPFLSARSLISSERQDKPGLVLVFSGDDGSKLVTLEGKEGEAMFGSSVASVGDLDGDRYPDVAVAATGLVSDGAVRVFSGKTWETLFEVQASDQLFVQGAGDVNADGVPDIVIGEPYADENGRDAGRARVVSGKSADTLFSWHGPKEFSYFGSAVSGLGDLDRDGHPEILVCATGLDGGGRHAGGASVFSGKDGRQLLSIGGPREDLELGVQCCSVPDVDGDGTPDFAIAAARDGSAPFVPGRTRVYSGRDGSILFEAEGTSAASAGDVDGDGQPELVLGICFAGDEKAPGVVRVLSPARKK